MVRSSDHFGVKSLYTVCHGSFMAGSLKHSGLTWLSTASRGGHIKWLSYVIWALLQEYLWWCLYNEPTQGFTYQKVIPSLADTDLCFKQHATKQVQRSVILKWFTTVPRKSESLHWWKSVNPSRPSQTDFHAAGLLHPGESCYASHRGGREGPQWCPISLFDHLPWFSKMSSPGMVEGAFSPVSISDLFVKVLV